MRSRCDTWLPGIYRGANFRPPGPASAPPGPAPGPSRRPRARRGPRGAADRAGGRAAVGFSPSQWCASAPPPSSPPCRRRSVPHPSHPGRRARRLGSPRPPLSHFRVVRAGSPGSGSARAHRPVTGRRTRGLGYFDGGRETPGRLGRRRARAKFRPRRLRGLAAAACARSHVGARTRTGLVQFEGSDAGARRGCGVPVLMSGPERRQLGF